MTALISSFVVGNMSFHSWAALLSAPPMLPMGTHPPFRWRTMLWVWCRSLAYQRLFLPTRSLVDQTENR